MKLIRNSLAVGLAIAGVTVAACSTGPHPTAAGIASNTNPGPADNSGASDATGALGMQLTLPGGEHISKINYTLTNGINTLTGSYNVSGTATLSFVIGSVPAGTGYSLSITGTSDDGNYTCSFPAPGDPLTSNITVVNRTTTVVNVNLQCLSNQGQDAGSILVNAVQSNCPVWNTIVANPYNITLDAGQNVNNSGAAGATAFLGGASPTAMIQDSQQLVLVGSATGPNPGALSFTWTTTGGTISPAAGTIDPNSTDAGTTNQTIFTCPATGASTFTVTLTVSDGPLPDGGSCDPKFTTGTVQVQCTSVVPCAGGIVATPNTAAGACPVVPPTVNAGVADGTGSFCCIAPPACPTGPFATPFPGGTCAAGLLNNNGCCVALQPALTAADVASGKTAQCSGNTSGICTREEAYFVTKDITNMKVTAPGPISIAAPTSSCYSCLVNASAINATARHVTGVECSDLAGNFTNGSAVSANADQTCFNLVSCLAGSTGAGCWGGEGSPAIGNDTFCYCGAGGYGTGAGAGPSACGTTNATLVNGNCLSLELAGFNSTVTGTNLSNFAQSSQPSGMANQLIESALPGNCQALCLH
jgi:hypothetical protein